MVFFFYGETGETYWRKLLFNGFHMGLPAHGFQQSSIWMFPNQFWHRTWIPTMYSDGPFKDKKWNLRTQFANIRVYVYVLIHMLTYTCMYIEYISMLYVHLEPQ